MGIPSQYFGFGVTPTAAPAPAVPDVAALLNLPRPEPTGDTPTPMPEPGFWAGMGAGFRTSTPGVIWQDMTSGSFKVDFRFDADKHFADKVGQNPQFTQDIPPAEMAILKAARSQEQFDYIYERMQSRKLENLVISARPVAGFIGQVLGDSALDAGIGAGIRGLQTARKALGVGRVITPPVKTIAEKVQDTVLLAATGTGIAGAYEAGMTDLRTADMNTLINGAVSGATFFASSRKAAPEFLGMHVPDVPAFKPLAEAIAPTGTKVVPNVTRAEAKLVEGVQQLMEAGSRDETLVMRALDTPNWHASQGAARIVNALGLDHVRPAEHLQKLLSAMDGRVGGVMQVPKHVAAQYKHLSEKVIGKYLPADAKIVLATGSGDKAAGFTVPLAPNTYLINVSPKEALSKNGFSTLFHELGHIVVNHHFKNMPDSIKEALAARFVAARELAQTAGNVEKAAAEVLSVDRVPLQAARGLDKVGAGTFEELVGGLTKGNAEGVLSLPEYMAEQFVKQLQDELAQGVTPYARTVYQKGTLQAYVQEVANKLSRLANDVAPYAKVAPEANAAFEWAAEHGLKYDKAAYDASLKSTVMVLDNSLRLANSKEVLERSSGFLGGSWASLYEKMAGLGTDAADLANKLVVDPLGTSANSAAMDVRRIRLTLGNIQGSIERSITEATGFNRLQQIYQRGAFLARHRELSEQMVDELHKRYAQSLRGEPIKPHPDPVVEQLLENYKNSRFAETALAEWKSSGVRGADGVTESPWYFPVQHSGAKLHEAIQSGLLTMKQAGHIYGQQFQKLFPDLTPAEALQAGNRMAKSITDPLYSGHKPGLFVGITRDEVEQVLADIGVDTAKADEFFRTFDGAIDTSGKARNLKRRLEWDMSLTMDVGNGVELGLRDFLNKDVVHTLEGYTRAMAGRAALARQGFDSLAAVDSAIAAAAKTSREPAKVREVFDNAVDSLLGRHVGEVLPDTVRTMGAMSAFLSLKNSGIYNVIDLAQTMHRYGVVKTIEAMTKGGLTLKGCNVAEAKRLQDILSGGLVSDGRWKAIHTLMDDGYQIPGATGHEMLQHVAQHGKYINGMEHIRRSLVNLNSGLAVDALYSAARGDNTMAQKLFQFGADGTLLDEVAAQLQKHGDDVSMWDQPVLAKTHNVLLNIVDNTVQANRLGEIPAFMQFSPVARILLPYLNFAAGAHNKILRRTLKHEDAVGIASLMAYQLSLSVLAAAATNVNSGKEWNEDLARKTTAVMPLSGWFGVISEFSQNGMRTTVAPFAMLQKAQEAITTVGNGDRSIKAMTGLLGLPVVPGMTVLLNHLDDWTGANERKLERLAEARAEAE